MTRSARLRVPVLTAVALLGLVLSACLPISTRHVAGPGMATRMGQGSTRCSTTVPRVGPRVDVVLMDMSRGAMTAGDGNRWMSGQRHGSRPVSSDRAVDESAALGEASASCAAGAGDGIEAGSMGWVTLRLAPGRYELVCNRPGHYAHGMYAELVVS